MSEQAEMVRRGRKATMARRTRRLGLALALAAGSAVLIPGHADALPPGAPKIGMVCTPGTVAGSTHTFNLIANTGYADTPDGNSIFMWSYANRDAPDNDHFQSPGPVLCVTEGETVVVNLTNTLPEPASIVFPGLEGVTATGGSAGLLTTEAAAGTGTVSYSFTAGNPGTYLYQSGSDQAKQVEMGLYGALIVRPNSTTCPVVAGTACAYGAATRFNPGREYLLLLSEIDPVLHHAVETNGTYNINARRARYFTINGREFPDTLQDNGTALQPNQPYGSLVRIQPNTGSNTQPALIRMINAGLLNHPFHPHGNHTTQIAQDGRVVARTEHFGETIGSGQTLDYLIRWDDEDQWDPTSNPLPVAQPNYRNLTFKDGNTFYSGTPYLGYKGTLPTGTVSQNVCGEWYFPWHSHALNEFANFDEAFGGMATLLRVDPPGGCFAGPTGTTIVGGVLKGGTFAALAVDDAAYYQVNPKTTTRPTTTSIGQTTITVASAAGFPTSGTYYIRIDNEVMQVTGGQGTTTWTVLRGQLGTAPATHALNATVTALANDWYAGFTGVPTGASNLKVTYKGKNCANTTGTTCVAIASNLPQQTVKICNWTIAGAAGCSSSTSAGWVTLPAPPAQPQSVGSTDVSSTWTLPGAGAAYVGTGTYKGQVRILVHTQRWTAPSPTAFSTWGNLMKIVYDAP
jgi:FtsP/CotA-like multicopper oxidase with cupredoxin domain